MQRIQRIERIKLCSGFVFADQTIEFRLATEVKEEAHLEVCCAQIAEDLTGGLFVKRFGCLDLDHDFVVDDHVQALIAEDPSKPVDGDANLASDPVAAFCQYVLQAGGVDRLQESKPRVLNTV
jgi:hypothetical protein